MSGLSPGGVLGRVQSAPVRGGRHGAVHKVRVSAEEEARLLVLAGGDEKAIVRVLRESALAGAGGWTVSERRELMEGVFGLRRVAAGVANNLNQLAREAHVSDGFPVVAVRALLPHLEEQWGPGGASDGVLLQIAGAFS